MEKLNLRTRLFGYRKSDVCKYIASMNEEFNRKLDDARAECEARQKQFDEDSVKMKSTIYRLSEENCEFRAKRDTVANALIDALAYSNEIRANADADAKAMLAENRTAYEKQEKLLEDYVIRIESLISNFRQILYDSEGALAPLADDMAQLENELAATQEENGIRVFSEAPACEEVIVNAEQNCCCEEISVDHAC
ncbi:MAG: hypothetical protein HUJ65_07055 [Oscillospiraceae bacterium]|nr:hypothetical protein [Oscillospiraceae bacterium]